MKTCDNRLAGIPAVLSSIALLVAAGCASPSLFSRYPQQACADYVHTKKEFTARINWCVRDVELREDAMEVRVSWQVVGLEGSVARIFQASDQNNRRMYLLDEFGGRYDHNGVSGAAKGNIMHKEGSFQTGSFLFSPPRSAARTFHFHDDDNGVVLEIRL